MVLLVDTPAKPESPSKSESVPGSPNQELLRRLSYLSRGDDSGAEDGAEEEAVVEEYSSTEVKALPTPHYHLQKWFPDDPSSIPKETQQLWLDRPSTPLIDPDCFARRRNFVVSDVHMLLVNSDNEERRRLRLSLEALGYACYWQGAHGGVARASGRCWQDAFEFWGWSNLVCTHRADLRQAIERMPMGRPPRGFIQAIAAASEVARTRD